MEKEEKRGDKGEEGGKSMKNEIQCHVDFCPSQFNVL